MSDSTVWKEFCTARGKAKDCRDSAAWYQRKREEATNPADYVHFAKLCNSSLKEQSDWEFKQTELYFQLVREYGRDP